MSRSCGCTGTDHRFRRFYITNLMPVSARRGGKFLDRVVSSYNTALISKYLTRSTEGLSAPLASLYSVIYARKHLSDFCVYQLQLPTIFWGRCFTLYSQSPACRLTGLLTHIMCQPNLRCGVDRGSRTLVYCLEGSYNTVIPYPHKNFSCSFV